MTTMLDDLKSVSEAARRPLAKLAYERLTRIFAQNQLIDLATNQVQRSPVVIFNRVAESPYTPYGIFVAPQIGDMRFVRHPDLVGRSRLMRQTCCWCARPACARWRCRHPSCARPSA